LASSAATSPVFFGIAGWSYPDWEGYVYPRGIKDKLDYVADYVDVIEINSSFYRPPDVRTVTSWAERTEKKSTLFTAKLHQDITHGGKIEPAMAEAFHKGLDPLAKTGKLKHLLAQFHHRYRDTPETRAYLKRIRETFGDIANIAFELRHNSWQAPATLAYLDSLKATIANLDYPTTQDSFNLTTCTIGEHAYFRLHGRNAQAWFKKNAGRDDVYNHLYNATELEEIQDRVVQIADKSKSVTIIANNHFRGKGLANIVQLKSMMTGNSASLPPLLAKQYPALEKDSCRQRAPTL
jgi:uncharacterized protein YecE (DUF72 family)